MRRYSLFGVLAVLSLKNVYDAYCHAKKIETLLDPETNSNITSTMQRYENKKHEQNALECLRDAAGYTLFGSRYYYPVCALPSSLFITWMGWENAWYNAQSDDINKEKDSYDTTKKAILCELKGVMWTLLSIGFAINCGVQVLYLYNERLYSRFAQSFERR